jgi:hypothetical protein
MRFPRASNVAVALSQHGIYVDKRSLLALANLDEANGKLLRFALSELARTFRKTTPFAQGAPFALEGVQDERPIGRSDRCQDRGVTVVESF